MKKLEQIEKNAHYDVSKDGDILFNGKSYSSFAQKDCTMDPSEGCGAKVEHYETGIKVTIIMENDEKRVAFLANTKDCLRMLVGKVEDDMDIIPYDKGILCVGGMGSREYKYTFLTAENGYKTKFRAQTMEDVEKALKELDKDTGRV